MFLNPAIVLSMLALTEAAVIERGMGYALTSHEDNDTWVTTVVDDKGKVMGQFTGNLAVDNAANAANAANAPTAQLSANQALTDSVASAFALTNSAVEEAISNAEQQATADAVAAAFALANANGANATTEAPAPNMAPAPAMAPAPDMAPNMMPMPGATPNAGGNNASVVQDGRIQSSAMLTGFDVANGNPYRPDFTKGIDVNFSQAIIFPTLNSQSLFDNKANTKAFEVTINDQSIFQNQTGFRRIGMLFSVANATNNRTTTGVKTLHMSFQYDPTRPLNFSHEYQLAWLETADFQTNQFDVKVGTILGKEADGNRNIVIQSNQNGKPNGSVQTLFTTPFTGGVWHNFAFTLDFDKNMIQTYYSTDQNPLVAQTPQIPNDLSGNGEYQFGLLKKSTDNAPMTDIAKGGFQEPGILEGMIYGGIFLEDSAGGLPVSLS